MKTGLKYRFLNLVGAALVLAGCSNGEAPHSGSASLEIHNPSTQASALTPSDPLYGLQSWYYDAIHLPEAWSITTGSSNIVVAVIDSGKVNHPDLNAKWLGGYDFFAGRSDSTEPAVSGAY